MGESRRGQIVERRLRLLVELMEQSRGRSSRWLARCLGCSRATVDRDLDSLRSRVGLVIERVRVNGEVWHRLNPLSVRVQLEPSQLLALAMARDVLAPLAGSAAVRELDKLAPAAELGGALRLGRAPARAVVDIVATLERAIETGHRVKLLYRSVRARGTPVWRTVEPICVRLTDGDAYLDAWAVDAAALRTYKLARVVSVEALGERAAAHPEVDIEMAFERAVKTWSGAPRLVAVRLDPEVAWLAPEYPLVSDQALVTREDGSVVVSATVAGLVEASRWVLSWGRHAEVLEPADLRESVAAELAAAAARYTGPRTHRERGRSSHVSQPHAAPATVEAAEGGER